MNKNKVHIDEHGNEWQVLSEDVNGTDDPDRLVFSTNGFVDDQPLVCVRHDYLNGAGDAYASNQVYLTMEQLRTMLAACELTMEQLRTMLAACEVEQGRLG